MLPHLYFWRLLVLSSWAASFCGFPAFASEPSGVLPTSGTPDGYIPVNSAIIHRNKGDNTAILREKVLASAVGTGGQDGGRFGSLHALDDLLRFRQSSADGLFDLQYMAYLTHALVLSSAEVTAYDLKRMPLHRFSSPLRPDQIAEIPLGSVGGPRPFHMFVLFTFVEGRTEEIAQSLGSRCKDCSAAFLAFRELSKAYKISDSSPGNEDALPVFFAIVNIGTRDGAGISAIHPAMQIPIVMHLPPTAPRGFCSSHEDPRCSGEEGGLSVSRTSRQSLSAARHRIIAAEFFGGALGDGWDDDEDKMLTNLLQQQERDNIRGKVHFFTPSQSQLFLLQRLKNEAPPEQRLLEWVNTRTMRNVAYAPEDRQVQVQTKRAFLLLLLPLLLLFAWWLFLKGVPLLRTNQWIVPVGGVVAYTLCSGGLIFSVIHSVPFAGYDEANMRYVLLAPTSRAQFMLEGVSLSCCSTLASLAALLLVRLPVSSKQVSGRPIPSLDENRSNPNIRPGKTSEDGVFSDSDAWWRRHLSAATFVVTAVIFVLCSGFVMQCYRTKAAWYTPVFWPSPLLPKGPLKVDWGNAF